MVQIFPDLWQMEKGSHFGLDLRMYLLKRKEGNVLFYYTDNFKELTNILKLGNIKFQFLSHHHEMQPALEENLKVLNPDLCFHKKATPYFNSNYSNIIQFDKNQLFSENIEVIYTPGHTNTNLCFRYQSPFGKTYLFVGDTIYLDNGHWNILVMPNEGGSYELLKKTLVYLKTLEVDVVICSVAVGENSIVEVTQSEWKAIINSILTKLC